MLEEMDRKNLGRYTIIKRLGGGGMGAVFKGRDVTLNRDVAIKVMHPHIASRPNFRERFLQEARVAARLDHPSIVQVYDFGQDNNLLYIVMEYIAGPNLESMLRDLRARKKWIVLSEAVELVRQVSLALNYAHEQGVLHRDIKPANIMIEPVRSDKLAYRPVLTDLGLAKLTEGGLVTEDGVSMGTPAYMSPEQALGKQTDRRSDVYSLGVLLYELAAGRQPFPIKSLTEAIRYHTQEQPPSPRSIRSDIPTGLEQVILKAMAKDPADRFPTAEAFAEALETTTDAVTQANAGPTEMEGAESLITNYQKSIVAERGPSLMDEFAQPSSLSQDRIQVLGPDKRTTSAPVKHPSMTIGRSAENDLVLDDSKVSRQHARIEYENGTYKVTDLNSSNGTFLANTRLLPGVPEVWMPNQALRLGDHWLRVVRAQIDGTVGSNMPHQTFSPNQFHTSMDNQVGIFLEEKQLSVEPGGTLTIQVVVLNQSNLVDQFRVHLEGVPARWVKVTPEEVSLMPGEQAPVNVSVQPPRSASSRAGRYPVSLKVTSKESPNQVAEERATLTLGAFSQFTSEMQPQKVRSGQTAQITVSNDGNTHDTFTLTHSDRGEELVFMPSKAQLRVPEGQSAAAKFKVQSRQRRFIGGEKTYAFTSQVTSTSGESKTHSGEVVSKALLPVWIIPVLLLTCLCASAAAFAGYRVYNGQIASATQTQSVHETAIAQVPVSVLTPTSTSTPLVIMITTTPEPTTQAPTLPPTGTPAPTVTPTSTKVPPTPTHTPTPTTTPSATPTFTPTTPPNYSLKFNGGKDYVSVPRSSSMKIGTAFTVEAWVEPVSLTSPGTYKGIVRGALGAPPADKGGSFVLFTDKSDYSIWGLSVCTPSCNSAISGHGNLQANKWQFLTGTYDGSVITIYLNGTKVASKSWPGAISPLYNYLVIGLWSSSFNGSIDEVRLWNVARSASDVQADMKSSPTGNPPGLVGYWRFNEGSGQTVADSTKNHNNGVLGAAGDPSWAPGFVPPPIIKFVPPIIIFPGILQPSPTP